MALLLIQPGISPAGQFDLKTHETVIGGEVGVFETIGLDSNGLQIIKIRKATTGDTGPFFLLDDGKRGYGINFGTTVVKTSDGFSSGADNGTRLGPSSYTGSNKITIWDKPGFYAITLDALADIEAVLKATAPGTGLTFNSSGKLLLGNASPTPLAYVIQYKFDEGLVTTNGNIMLNKKLIIFFNPFGLAA